MNGAQLRVQLAERLQIMLVTIHVMREKLETIRIAAMLAAKRSIALPAGRTSQLISLDAVQILVPNFCYNPGSNLLRVQLNQAFKGMQFDLKSKRNNWPLEAIKWY